MRQQRSIPYRAKRGQAFLYLRNPLSIVTLSAIVWDFNQSAKGSGLCAML
jgi:hypothetical protein